MEEINCEICEKKEENGSLELYAYALNQRDVIIKRYVCCDCAEKIKKFIEKLEKE